MCQLCFVWFWGCVADQADTALAQHVLHVHRHMEPPKLDFEPMSASDIRAYVATARTFQPHIPTSLSQYISVAYAELRSEEAADKAPTTYTTARTLLSILRMSQVCLWFTSLDR